MKIKLAVFFGGESPEHEVSVITGLQLMKNADRNKYDVIPVYVDKKGNWWTGEKASDPKFFQKINPHKPGGLAPFKLVLESENKQIDMAILCFHGAGGEKGHVQGLLELAHIPYQGPSVTSSAICFDKIYTRQILKANDLPQTEFTFFTQADWENDKNNVLGQVEKLGLPVYVKPANGGSTIGIQRVADKKELSKVIQEVLQFDSRILVEAEVKDCIEVNVSVLGDQFEAKASVPEQPIASEELLSFADKYEKGGGKKSGMASATRRIPAPISSDLTTKLQKLAVKVFKLLDCSGVVRIDFFVNPSSEDILITEINTIPGSMSFYLWEASGVKYPELIDKLVEIAHKTQERKSKLVTTFETNILQKNTI